jgi:transcriptional regulator with XRE-family HTH domain
MTTYVIMNEEQTKNKVSPLKELRLATGLTQEQMARKLNVTLSTFRRWERGITEPSLTRKEWTEFCSLVGVEFNDLPIVLSEMTTK